MTVLRTAVTGTGYMGQLEARLCAILPGFELAGLHNRSEGKARALAAELGCQAFASLDDLLDERRPDALIVATPNHAHLAPVLAAARRGVHVFLEKPMGLHVQECHEMLAAARDAGVVLFMGHPQRFMEGVREARRAVLAGEIGRPVALRIERLFWLDTQHTAPGWKTRKRESGGHLFHHMHELDTARWILGDVASVFAQMDNLAHPGAEDGEEDVVQVFLRYRQGTLGTAELGSAYRRRSHFLRIDGSEGTVLIDWQAEGGGKVMIVGRDPVAQRQASAAPACADELRPRIVPIYSDPACRQSAAETYAAMDRGLVHGGDHMDAPLFLRELVRAELECFHRYVTTGQVELDLRGLVEDDGLHAVELAQAACLSAKQCRVIDLPL